MTSSRLQHLRDLITQDANAANIELPGTSPEPTTERGTKRGNAALDTPPPGQEESSLIVEGPRSRKPTSKISQYNEERTSARSRSATREYDKALRDDRAVAESAAELTDASRQSATHSNRGRRSSKSSTRSTKAPPKARGRDPAPKTHHGGGPPNAKKRCSISGPKGRVRVRDVPEEEAEERLRMRRDLRDIPALQLPVPPTMKSSKTGIKRVASKQKRNHQYTFIEETAGYETLAAFAVDRLGQDFDGWDDEDIQTALDIAEDQAYEVQPPQPETEIIMLETPSSRISGGWANQANTALATSLGKRAAEYQSTQSTVKRIRTSDPNDSATEPESDDEPTTVANQSDPPPHPPPPPPPLHQDDSRPLIAPLERVDTGPIALEAPLDGQPQPSPPSLGGRSAHLPALLNTPSEHVPTRGPVHARMKRKLAAREHERDIAKRRAAPAPENQGSGQEGISAPPSSSSPPCLSVLTGQ
ncbi:hypothetical protein RhiJN_19349 [Ceratobasidium sp. AG-Ba]|nr:hypothetical protein RhiJN_19349 [Ceratobasidium sp. AG-Ba]